MRTTAEQLHRDLEKVLGTSEPLRVSGTPSSPVDLNLVLKDAKWLLRNMAKPEPAPSFLPFKMITVHAPRKSVEWKNGIGLSRILSVNTHCPRCDAVEIARIGADFPEEGRLYAPVECARCAEPFACDRGIIP